MAADSRAEEAATGTVESVLFSFLTTEEIRRMSVKKITRPDQVDVRGLPVPGGLYDLAMGPMNDADSCKTCGQLCFRCPGHCGHVDFALPIYNPLLFRTLCNFLQITCFFCYKFRIPKKKVQFYVKQLDLIINGDIAAYKDLGEKFFDSEKDDVDAELSDRDIGKCHDIDSERCHTFTSIESNSRSKNRKTFSWTSLQQTETISVLHRFMGERTKKCENCGSKNPSISSPIYGIINTTMRSSDIRANIIGGADIDDLANESSDDVVTADGLTSVEKTSHGKRHNKMHEEEPSAKFAKHMKLFSGQLLPSKARFILENLWKNEKRLCMLICDIQQQNTHLSSQKNYNIFFMESLLVPPTRFRPTSRTGDKGQVLVNPQNTLLTRVIESNITLLDAIKNGGESSVQVQKWTELQRAVNVLFDSSKGFGEDKEKTGLRQLLERKEGVLRQKMMGKRVNFACRSVISPDPYLAVNEIGVPPQFAVKLTYPERVTTWNVEKLRHAIINGTEFHPGATHYKDKERLYILNLHKNVRISISRKLSSSRGSHVVPAKSPDTEFEGKIVHRHLKDGDVVLVNRQPTLHKPSMKAHVVRVLKGERTLRFHYANCSTYNADFDGDEMNVHLPQDEISRAEALNIVDANRQFIVPTSGKPDRGLIQDHIVSAVLLTKLDTFLTRDEFQELLYASLVPDIGSGVLAYKPDSKVSFSLPNSMIELLPPCIWKPVPLWSGKQVITSVLNRITRGHPAFSVKKTVKIPLKFLGDQKIFKKESMVRIDCNEFLYGVIDKEQFTMYGLVHTVYELYGPDAAGILLSTFSRLFTVFLQMHGFTCGLDDLLVVPKSDKKRISILKRSEKKSEEAHKEFAGVDKNADVDPIELQIKIEKTLRLNGEAATAALDRKMSNAMNELTSKVNEASIPNGLHKSFVRNCVSLMTTTGAKGSLVNFTQISSLLGQQSLEGKRVPRMVSGKTLPCFPPYDTSSRSGGFISDRFLTGLRSQEYYFHCMAGREGLVDTAIKTSRSGYLQRCLIKNLESLKVCYDHTVRDVDGSIVSFVYGEDGVDTHNTSFLRQFKTLASNHRVIFERLGDGSEDYDLSILDIPDKLRNDSEKYFEKYSEKNLGKGENKKVAGSYLLRKDDFNKLMRLKYLTSLVPPGEAVGVLAAQSVGEPSTQMTLNTFHLAGRGEVNVTLGIPRLQEILMSAKENIKTPTMTCPVRKEMTREDAESLAAKLRRISVADIIESMEVCIVPFFVSGNHVSTVYKLTMRLYAPELYPPGCDLSLEDCLACLEDNFTVAMDVAIKKQLGALNRISGIQVGFGMRQTASEEGKDEEETDGKSNKKKENDDESNDEDDDMEDQGADGQKRKMQGRDEVEYDDDIEKESTQMGSFNNEVDDEMPSGFGSEIDQVDEDEDHTIAEGKMEIDQGDDDSTEEGQEEFTDAGSHESPHKIKSSDDQSKNIEGKTASKPKEKRKGKRSFERVSFVEKRGLEFEVHFVLENEPHILLSEIAQRTAKNVFIQQLSNIEQCLVVEKKDKGATFYELQTAGVNFPVFWDLDEDLDINQIKSNDIHAILKTYGVEAARQTIIDEITSLFNAYGVSVGARHLSLIADFMTFDGGYRPMNRRGMTSYSTSPFGKITFETATKFSVEAALYGEIDTLEGPSASICLGQPVKMGTGCFDLLHNLDVQDVIRSMTS